MQFCAIQHSLTPCENIAIFLQSEKKKMIINRAMTDIGNDVRDSKVTFMQSY